MNFEKKSLLRAQTTSVIVWARCGWLVVVGGISRCGSGHGSGDGRWWQSFGGGRGVREGGIIANPMWAFSDTDFSMPTFYFSNAYMVSSDADANMTWLLAQNTSHIRLEHLKFNPTYSVLTWHQAWHEPRPVTGTWMWYYLFTVTWAPQRNKEEEVFTIKELLHWPASLLGSLYI